ncbi:MAG: peroxide stress protein YaaA [Agathobacter sp.]
MKIIISPAKKMMADTDSLGYASLPVYIKEAEEIGTYLRQSTLDELKKLWACNDKIAELNYERIQNLDLYSRLTPAILAYEGIQYQYMAPAVFEEQMLTYVQEHVRILSGFYGVLKPMDGIVPYRLEMQAKAKINGHRDLYDYWGRKLFDEVTDESHIILNLASREYSKCVERYLEKEDRFVTCIFGELAKGKVVQKGTYAKMARGEMVRYMAEKRVTNLEEVKGFNRLDYTFSAELSTEQEYVFLR